MQRIAQSRLGVAAVAIRVVVDHRVDAVRPADRPVHITFDTQQAADRQRPPDIVSLPVVHSALQRLLIAVPRAVLHHICFDILAACHALDEGRLIQRRGVVDRVIEVNECDQHAGGLIPGPTQAATGRAGRIIPRALVAVRIDLSDGVEEYAAGLRVLLIARHRVGERQPVAPFLVGLDNPGVVGADEVVDAPVFGHIAGALIRVLLVRQEVAAAAFDGTGPVEAAVGAAPGPPLGRANRTPCKAVRKRGPLLRAVLMYPLRVLVHHRVSRGDDIGHIVLRPLVLLDVLLRDRHIFRRDIDTGMDLACGLGQVHVLPPLFRRHSDADLFARIMESQHFSRRVVHLFLIALDDVYLEPFSSLLRESEHKRPHRICQFLADLAAVGELDFGALPVGVYARVTRQENDNRVQLLRLVEADFYPLRQLRFTAARPPGPQILIIQRFIRVLLAGLAGCRGSLDLRASYQVRPGLVLDDTPDGLAHRNGTDCHRQRRYHCNSSHSAHVCLHLESALA